MIYALGNELFHFRLEDCWDAIWGYYEEMLVSSLGK